MYGLIVVGMITAVLVNTYFLSYHHEIVSSVENYSVLSKVCFNCDLCLESARLYVLLNVIFVRLLFLSFFITFIGVTG